MRKYRSNIAMFKHVVLTHVGRHIFLSLIVGSNSWHLAKTERLSVSSAADFVDCPHLRGACTTLDHDKQLIKVAFQVSSLPPDEWVPSRASRPRDEDMGTLCCRTNSHI